VTVEFVGGVTATGTTAAACYRSPNAQTPVNFQLDSNPVYPTTCDLPPGSICASPGPLPSFSISCDVSTTASYSGLIKVCFPHSYSADRLLHYNTATGLWEDITIEPVRANEPICGLVASLSPFLINAAPVLSVPTDLTLEATSAQGRIVAYSATAEDPDDGPVAASCEPASGSVFPLGATTVNCSAQDAAGETSTASFVVHVADTTAPLVIAPAPITISATESGGATAAASPALAQWLQGATASDVVDPSPVGGATVPQTTLFPIGTTTVTFRFTDASGNSGTATSTVTVVAVTGTPRIDVTVAAEGIVSGTRHYVDLVFTNIGGGTAFDVGSLVVPVATRGFGLIRVVSPTRPLALGDLTPGASTTVRIVLDVPRTVKEMLVIEAGAFWNARRQIVPFADAQPVTPTPVR
jgi:hypothetical protein